MPWMSLEITRPSDTAFTGGRSKMMKSKFWDGALTTELMRSEPSSSDGLGGTSPEVMTFRFSSRPTSWMTSPSRHRPASRLDRPGAGSMARRRARLGRRMSASTSSTRFPVSAMV